MIQLHQLEQFCVIAMYEHMSKAADILNISQPTLSLNLQRLENELGVKLFDRVGRNIILNEYGKAFYSHASAALEELRIGQSKVNELRKNNTQEIFVGDSILNNVYQVVDVYMTKHPGVKIVHQSCLVDNLCSMLLMELIDLGIVVISPDNPLIRQFDWFPITTTRLMAMIPDEHPLAKQDTIKLKDLENEPLEFAIRNYDSRDAFDQYCSSVSIIPNIVYSSVKPFLFNDMTRKNGYISFIPEILWINRTSVPSEYMESHMNTNKIVARTIIEPELTVVYGILTKKGKKYSQTANNFRDFAIEYMKENISYF